MKTSKNPQWLFYLGWILSGVIGFLITFPVALVFAVFVFDQIIGDMIMVRGEMVITEDYMFWYAFVPWYGLVVGTLQYILLRKRLAKMGWWILTTTLGWSLVWLGIALRNNPLGDIEIPSSAGYFLIAGTGVGLLIGITQWLIMRLHVPHAGWWIPINGLGFGIASVLLVDSSSLSEYMIAVTIPCISTGILLWLLLGQRLSQAGWWTAANVVGWGLLALISVGNAPATTRTVAETCSSVSPTSTLIATSTPTETVELKKMLLLYDDDGSRDGMAALLYFLSYPDISIQAITISYGEAHPKLYIQHMGCVLDIFGISDIPLGAGQDMPLAGGTPFPDWLRQLSDNFWDYPLPNADKTYPFQNAPNLMVSIINQAPEPITIFVSGPFTNLAQALQLDPVIKNNISAVYFMGGAVLVPGNITNLVRDSNNRVSDWNMIADPQAAKEVFESGLELYMVPLDATNKVLFSQEDILPWRQGDDKANMIVDLTDIMFNTWGLKTAEIFDLTAAVLMLQPESCVFQPLHLHVITDNGPTLGQTIVVPNTEPNIYVCLEPNIDQVKQNLYETFSR